MDNLDRYTQALTMYARAESEIAYYREQIKMYERIKIQAGRTIEALRPLREAA